jgi:hypothetical protein
MNVYVIYAVSMETGVSSLSPFELEDVKFHDKIYKSFNRASESIKAFAEEYAENKGLELTLITKKDLEGLKLTKKKTDTLFVRIKTSEAILYRNIVNSGYVYNSYPFTKVGKIGIKEFQVPIIPKRLNHFTKFRSQAAKSVKDEEDVESESEESFDFEPVATPVTNYEHGQHVSFVHELKTVLKKRNQVENRVEVAESKVDNSVMESFIASLKEGKKNLNHVSPPVRKINLEEEEESSSELSYSSDYDL